MLSNEMNANAEQLSKIEARPGGVHMRICHPRAEADAPQIGVRAVDFQHQPLTIAKIVA